MDYKNCKLDEQLIAEVQQHGVIYNRQKYFFNNTGGGNGKYESKDDAWQIIAMKLSSDVDTCKKRWKYLRERYVSQRKQSDPPVYEHLSRPYLEKMKFLDQHIQPRKSYRNVTSFLGSPGGGGNYSDYMETRSSSSMKNHYANYHENMFVGNGMGDPSAIKTEPEQAFREFAAAFASQQQHQQQQPFYNHIPASVSSSSSLKSPPSSSCSGNNDNDKSREDSSQQQKKPRVEEDVQRPTPTQTPPNTQYHHQEKTDADHFPTPCLGDNLADSSDDNECIDDPPDIIPPIQQTPQPPSHHTSGTPTPTTPTTNHQHHNNLNGRSSHNNTSPDGFPMISGFRNNDFQYQMSQQMHPANLKVSRTSEQLLGELVTAELLKMNKERRRAAQKKILEILFFED